MNPKTLEIIVRSRSEPTDLFAKEARSTRGLTRDLDRLDDRYRQHVRAREQAAQRLARADRLEQRIGSLPADRQDARRALIEQQRAAAQQALLQAQTGQQAALRQQRRAAANTLDQARLNTLQREAAAGRSAASAELQRIQLARQHRTERQGLARLLTSEIATERQKITARRQLLALTRAQRREEQAIAIAGRRRLLRSVGAGALGGAAAAGINPGAGLLVGAGAGLGGAGLAAAGGAAGLAFGGVKAIQVAKDYEFALDRVRAITQATAEQMAQLDQRAQQLGRTTVFTAAQAAEAMSNLAIAGQRPEEIFQSIGPVMNLAAAGQIDLADSARILARIMAGMKIEAKDLGGTVDLLTKAFTTANTDLSELGTAMSFVGPVAKTTGRDLAEIVAIVQALSNAGLAGEKAGTAARQILIKLASQTGESKQTLADLNIELTDAAGNLKALPDIIDKFNNALGGLGDSDRLDVLATVFEARAAAGFATLMEQGGDQIRRFEEQLHNAGGTAQRVADDQLDNLQGSLVRLHSAASGLGIAIGETTNGPIREGVDGLTTATNAVTDLIKELDRLTDKLSEKIPGGNDTLLYLIAPKIKGAFDLLAFAQGQANAAEADVQRLSKAQEQLAEIDRKATEARRQGRTDALRSTFAELYPGLRTGPDTAGLANTPLDDLQDPLQRSAGEADIQQRGRELRDALQFNRAQLDAQNQLLAAHKAINDEIRRLDRSGDRGPESQQRRQALLAELNATREKLITDKQLVSTAKRRIELQERLAAIEERAAFAAHRRTQSTQQALNAAQRLTQGLAFNPDADNQRARATSDFGVQSSLVALDQQIAQYRDLLKNEDLSDAIRQQAQQWKSALESMRATLAEQRSAIVGEAGRIEQLNQLRQRRAGQDLITQARLAGLSPALAGGDPQAAAQAAALRTSANLTQQIDRLRAQANNPAADPALAAQARQYAEVLTREFSAHVADAATRAREQAFEQRAQQQQAEREADFRERLGQFDRAAAFARPQTQSNNASPNDIRFGIDASQVREDPSHLAAQAAQSTAVSAQQLLQRVTTLYEWFRENFDPENQPESIPIYTDS
ncbi:MAG: phage tail tape measure protein [Planctomycetota bacterium]